MDTSTQAHAEIEGSGRAATLRKRILDMMRNGVCTADEAAAAMHENVLAVRPRFSELRKAGYIRDTGLRRKNDSGKNAAVWQIDSLAEAAGMFS